VHLRDARVQLVTDLIQGIAVVKHNTWRVPFSHRINQLRDQEMKYLKQSGVLDAFNMSTFVTLPILISLAVFGTTHLLGNQMDASKVFPSLVLYNMLRSNFTIFVPRVVRSLSESKVLGG
jgi:ATP-binding cassette subfamily C (CFTR/MRP) protein 4